MIRKAIWASVLLPAIIVAATQFVTPAPTMADPAEAEIRTDLSKLPEPVRKMHSAILEAACSGDIEMLRPILEMNELRPTVSFGGADDPIRYWKKTSGDSEGRQILAILVEILEMPYVHINAGKAVEMFVWPYLAEVSLAELAPPQLVDLYRLVTPEQAKTMKDFGGYIHYRLGIGPDGTWHYFVAGD